jgi:hypothetical protein
MVKNSQPNIESFGWELIYIKEGRGALHTNIKRGCYARAISGTVISISTGKAGRRRNTAIRDTGTHRGGSSEGTRGKWAAAVTGSGRYSGRYSRPRWRPSHKQCPEAGRINKRPFLPNPNANGQKCIRLAK